MACLEKYQTDSAMIPATSKRAIGAKLSDSCSNLNLVIALQEAKDSEMLRESWEISLSPNLGCIVGLFN